MKIILSAITTFLTIGTAVGAAQKPCAAAQTAYCRDDWCPSTCGTEVSAADYDRCIQACQPCCKAIDPFATLDFICQLFFGVDCTYTVSTQIPPQCKKYQELSQEYGTPLLGIDESLYSQEKKDVCNVQCGASCGSDKTCYTTCLPCCKGLLQNQCYSLQPYQSNVPQCKKFKAKYPNQYANLCFPSDATVQSENGDIIRMDELKIGDKVAVAYEDDSIGYEPIYQFGHQSDSSFGMSYIKLSVVSPTGDVKELTMSETHYLPVHEDGKLVTAGTIDVGTSISILDDETKTIVEGTIEGKQHVASWGAFNPYTMNGNIIVDGVVASSHNDWSYAETLVPSMVKPLLPGIYEMMLSVHRWGYTIFGAEKWAKINANVDMSAPAARKTFGAAAMSAYAYFNMASGNDEIVA